MQNQDRTRNKLDKKVDTQNSKKTQKEPNLVSLEQTKLKRKINHFVMKNKSKSIILFKDNEDSLDIDNIKHKVNKIIKNDLNGKSINQIKQTGSKKKQRKLNNIQ